MRVIIGAPGSGKTLELIKMSAARGYRIVCDTLQRAEKIQAQAKEMGYDIPQPVSFTTFLSHPTSPLWIKGFLLDDADQLLQRLVNRPIAAITISDTNNIEHIGSEEEER